MNHKIIELYEDGESIESIADKFKVAMSYIVRVIYKHLTKDFK